MPWSIPCATGSCRVNGVHSHRWCTHLADSKFTCGTKSVVIRDIQIRFGWKLDNAFSPRHCYLSCRLLGFQGASHAVQVRAKTAITGAFIICGMVVEGLTAWHDSASISIVENPEAWEQHSMKDFVQELQALPLDLPTHLRQSHDAAIKQY